MNIRETKVLELDQSEVEQILTNYIDATFKDKLDGAIEFNYLYDNNSIVVQITIKGEYDTWIY